MRSPFLVSNKVAQRAEVEVEFLFSEPERFLEFVHPLGQSHERPAEPLDLLGRERPALDAVKSLALHQLTQQLDDRQHQVRQTLLELLGIGVDPSAHVASPAGEVKLYGGHGPVHVISGSFSWSSRSRNSSS